jgi:hypothetical protein
MTGTTLVAAKFKDGVVIGADSRSVKGESNLRAQLQVMGVMEEPLMQRTCPRGPLCP